MSAFFESLRGFDGVDMLRFAAAVFGMAALIRYLGRKKR
jgi:hypothetical protein